MALGPGVELLEKALADSNLKQFDGRLRRIEKAQRKGYGFEAVGTAGRSHKYRTRPSIGRYVRGAVLFVAFAWVMKGAIFFAVGPQLYEARIARLAKGTDFDPIAARLMAPDPVTRLIASFIGEVLPQFR